MPAPWRGIDAPSRHTRLVMRPESRLGRGRRRPAPGPAGEPVPVGAVRLLRRRRRRGLDRVQHPRQGLRRQLPFMINDRGGQGKGGGRPVSQPVKRGIVWRSFAELNGAVLAAPKDICAGHSVGAVGGRWRSHHVRPRLRQIAPRNYAKQFRALQSFPRPPTCPVPGKMAPVPGSWHRPGTCARKLAPPGGRRMSASVL